MTAGLPHPREATTHDKGGTTGLRMVPPLSCPRYGAGQEAVAGLPKRPLTNSSSSPAAP